MRRLGLVGATCVLAVALSACGTGNEVEPAVSEPSTPVSPSEDSVYGGTGVPYGSAVDSANDTADRLESRNGEIDEMGGG